MKRSTLTAAIVALFVSIPAAAHDLWIEPSSFRPAPGTDVTARLLVGQKVRGESLPRYPELIARFVLKGEGPEIPVDGEPGGDPAGLVRVTEPGLQWIGYQSHPYPVLLDAGKFEAYLRDEGLERIIEERARKDLSAAAGRERFYRCAKSLLYVPGEKPPSRSAGVFDTPLGFTLELVPLKNPYSLSPGGELPVSLTFRGQPVSNVLVVAMNRDDSEKPVSARTDAKGLVKLRLPRPGFWLVKAVYMQAAPQEAGVDWESWWASISFDLASSLRK